MQYYYLVCTNFDETTAPRKIFLQEQQAITWGRRLATRLAKDEFYANFDVALYKQPITRSGELKFVRSLAPYSENPNSCTHITQERDLSGYVIGDGFIEDVTFG